IWMAERGARGARSWWWRVFSKSLSSGSRRKPRASACPATVCAAGGRCAMCGGCIGGGDSACRASAATRSPAESGASISVVSVMRRVHSRTLPCSTNRSRSCAISTSATACASSTAATEAASSRPNRDCGHNRRSIGPGGELLGEYVDADHVPLAVHGLDDLRRARIIAENLAQPADAHVDAAVERIGIAPAQQLCELRARQHAVAGPEQYSKQPILGAAQGHFPAVPVAEGARDGVEPPAAEAEAAYGVGARIAWCVSRATQYRLDSPEQLARVEGLGDVVIGAELESDDAIDVLATRGQHDDR